MKKISRNNLTKVISGKDTILYHEDLQKVIFKECKITIELNTIHQRRYMHGDMKPNNILVNEQGQFFIIDLGSWILIEEITLHRMI
jgi:serine/threonine protein kinase